jgi:hypothetical protein
MCLMEQRLLLKNILTDPAAEAFIEGSGTAQGKSRNMTIDSPNMAGRPKSAL